MGIEPEPDLPDLRSCQRIGLLYDPEPALFQESRGRSESARQLELVEPDAGQRFAQTQPYGPLVGDGTDRLQTCEEQVGKFRFEAAPRVARKPLQRHGFAQFLTSDGQDARSDDQLRPPFRPSQPQCRARLFVPRVQRRQLLGQQLRLSGGRSGTVGSRRRNLPLGRQSRYGFLQKPYDPPDRLFRACELFVRRPLPRDAEPAL